MFIRLAYQVFNNLEHIDLSVLNNIEIHERFVQLRNRDGRSDTMRGLGTYLNNFGQTAALLWPIHTIKDYILSSKMASLSLSKMSK